MFGCGPPTLWQTRIHSVFCVSHPRIFVMNIIVVALSIIGVHSYYNMYFNIYKITHKLFSLLSFSRGHHSLLSPLVPPSVAVRLCHTWPSTHMRGWSSLQTSLHSVSGHTSNTSSHLPLPTIATSFLSFFPLSHNLTYMHINIYNYFIHIK